MSFSPTSYQLTSVATGAVRPDEGGWTLGFADEGPGLIRADYASNTLTVRDELDGLYRFADWLPIRRTLRGSGAPVTYRSEGLAEVLELENLWITFNGWWPEKGGNLRTGTFKEYEAYSVGGRMGDDFGKVLVVASAGNTARAFARVCSDNGIPLLLFVPEDNLGALWFDEPIAANVKLIAAASGGDYFDAIRMSNAAITGWDGCIAEGGAKNVARRDGMGTTVLSAATTIGRIPDAYFQAVGSGTGAIAAWEMAMRLEADGSYGANNMRLLVSQNDPFVPMLDTWKADSRDFIVSDDDTARHQVEEINAKVLSNRHPPWGLPGGLYDALKATDGDVITATNEEAAVAAERFAQLEGNDVSPAAAVAVASLFKAVETGSVVSDEVVMLNITGGGMERFKTEHDIVGLEPSVVFPLDASEDDIVEASRALFE